LSKRAFLPDFEAAEELAPEAVNEPKSTMPRRIMISLWILKRRDSILLVKQSTHLKTCVALGLVGTVESMLLTASACSRYELGVNAYPSTAAAMTVVAYR
jgi:hypothetical protein